MVSIFLCSIDSFLASLGIGLLGCSETRRRKLILAFAACDLSATLAGASLHSCLAQYHRGGLIPLLAPIVLAGVAAAVLTYCRKSPALFLWVPALLSLDNFIGGLLDGSPHVVRSPLIAGLASGLLAWSGFGLARVAGPLFSRRSTLVTSVSLMTLAFVLAY
jgi:putative Mn2+ efflux pump MntP